MNKKLILFDIDGTLVSYKKKTYIPNSTIKAIDLLKQNGHIIAIASGRSLCTAKGIMEKLKIDTAILHNGAQILMNNESIFEKRIPKRVASKICEILSKTELCVFAFDGERIYAHHITEESKQFIEEQAGQIDFIKPLKDNIGSLFSINIYGNSNDIPINFAEYKNLNFNENMCELSAKGISKGKALQTLSKKLKIDMKDTIAVGDGLNDIDMLKTSEIGIAVGNACEELKSVADMVTGKIEDGGIYEAFQVLNLI